MTSPVCNVFHRPNVIPADGNIKYSGHLETHTREPRSMLILESLSLSLLTCQFKALEPQHFQLTELRSIKDHSNQTAVSSDLGAHGKNKEALFFSKMFKMFCGLFCSLL